MYGEIFKGHSYSLKYDTVCFLTVHVAIDIVLICSVFTFVSFTPPLTPTSQDAPENELGKAYIEVIFNDSTVHTKY